MIKLLRIDDRLVHGQVATYYVNMTGADTILVANDKYAASDMLKMTLSVAKPVGCKMPIRSVQDSIAYLHNPAKENRKILMIVGSVKDAVEICRNCESVQEIDIGGIRKAEGARAIANQVFLTEADLEGIKQISEMGRHIYLQEVPSKPAMSVKEIESSFYK